MAIAVKDSDWIRQSLLLPKLAIDQVDMVRRTFSNDYRKFSDTTLGGNPAINPPAQFTRFADLKARRFHQVGYGMGRYYSEVIDDNAVLVHMRFGNATFNSLTGFFGNFYNPDAASWARQGRSAGLSFFLGELIGFVVTIGFMPYIWAGQLVKFLFGKQQTKYYYLKPNMVGYWNAVQMLCNSIAVNHGFIEGVRPEQYGVDVTGNLTAEDAAQRAKLLPDIWRVDGSLDINAVVTKHQRLADKQYRKLQKIREEATDSANLTARWQNFLNEPILEDEYRPMNEYIKSYLSLSQGQPSAQAIVEIDSVAATQTETSKAAEAQTKSSFLSEISESVSNYFGDKNTKQEDTKLSDFLLAELRDGSQFVSFRVDNPGTVGESFTSSVKESAIASAFNSTSSAADTARFNFAGGNLDDGIIGTMVGAGVQAVKRLVGGILSSVSMQGLAALAGNALVDIPQQWDKSTANLPRMSYTIELRSPYGNDASRFQNLMVPLAMLLAGTLPLSTGTASYTSPFLVELYCRGRAQTRLGIIDSMEITRGAGNIGWTQDGKPLGIDISFSVIDLSSIMHMPLVANYGLLSPFTPNGLNRMLTGDDTVFGDYVAVLSGLGLTDQIYQTKKLKRNFQRTLLDFQDWTSPANFANWVGGLYPLRVISGFANGTNRA
jgi:hypothetical protein